MKRQKHWLAALTAFDKSQIEEEQMNSDLQSFFKLHYNLISSSLYTNLLSYDLMIKKSLITWDKEL